MEKNNFILRNVKGTNDFAPSEQAVRNQIIDILKDNFVKYGYMPLETPILNEYDLLKYKYGDGAEILNEVYTLTDQGKRKLGLRFDLTVPFCKYIGLNKDLTMPFRRYEIGRVFRDGPVKLGRTREFYQCDIDAVGIDGRYIEVEQMQMVKKIFDKLGIDILIKWNNRKLMCGLLSYLGIKEDKFESVISLIDRFDKLSEKELFEEFEKEGIDNALTQKLLDIFDKDLRYYESLKCDNENFVNGLAECLEIEKYIAELGLENATKFCPKLARGQNIYTGTVFEFYDKELRISSSLGGGGRYDKIITDFMDNGMAYPAVGLSFGLEPIYAILKSQYSQNFVDVMLIPMDTQVKCLQIAEKLREIGARVITDFSSKKIKKAFDYANKQNIKFVMVVGENEINSGLYSIKDMEKGEQYSLELDKLVEFVKENLK